MKSAGLVLLVLLAFPAFASKEKFRDDQMLRDVHTMFWEAWNKHDAKQMSASFAEDATVVSAYGRLAVGREAIEKLFAEEQAASMKDSQALPSELKIQFITRNIAVVDEEIELGGMRSPEGKIVEPRRLRLSNVISKKAGKWWIAASRPYFIPADAPEIARK